MRYRFAIGTAFLAACALIFAWNYHLAFQQFGGNDGGILINVAWTQYLGLVPYRDVPTVLPALFVYPAGWAFDLGGPTWRSLTWLVCLFSLVTFGWSFSLLWAATRRAWTALGFALLIQMIAMFPLSWWWYNQITALMLAIYFGSALFLIREPGNRFARASFCVALALTAFAKANTAGVLLVLSLVVLLIDKRTRRFVLIATFSAALFDLLFLWLNHIGPVLLLQNYLQLGQRLTVPTRWYYCLGLYEWNWAQSRLDLMVIAFMVASFGFLFWFTWPFLKREGLRFSFSWMFLTACAVLFIGSITDSDLKPVETTCLVMLVPFLRLWPARPIAWIPAYLGLTYCAITSLTIGLLRERVLIIGRAAFFQPVPLTEIQEPALFRGVQSGPILQNVLSATADILKKQDSPPSKKVFFGPRMDFLYAAFQLPFQPGLPICWEKVASTHHGENLPFGIHMADMLTSPSRWIPDGEPLDPRVQHFIDAKFDLCIFLKGSLGLADMTCMPADVRAAVYENYTLAYHGPLAVFTRKLDGPVHRSSIAGQ